MAFIFTMRSTSVNGHRRTQSGSTTLPAIDEDNASFVTNNTNVPPPVPARAWNRPKKGIGGFGTGSAQGWQDVDPPAYDNLEKAIYEHKLAKARHGWMENRHIVKRGGWKKLLLLLLLLLLVIVGLGVGLGVGLKKKKSSSGDANSASSDTSSTTNPSGGGASGEAITPPSTLDTPPNATFPVGSYTFHTYLNTVATNCTSNPATWMCYPSSTYAQDRDSSAATFDWLIRSSSTQEGNYTISSTPNPFSILFDSTPLQLLKQGQPDEHYFFQLSMTKPTKPTTQLGTENIASTCYFDNTTLQGYLYTKMEKTYPKDEKTTSGFEPWPGAIKIEQVAGATAENPRCVDSSGNSLGDFGVEDGSQLCDCLWLNTGT